MSRCRLGSTTVLRLMPSRGQAISRSDADLVDPDVLAVAIACSERQALSDPAKDAGLAKARGVIVRRRLSARAIDPRQRSTRLLIAAG